MTLHAFTQDLDGGKFVNVYDISCPREAASPNIVVNNKPTSVLDYAQRHSSAVTASGSFFFLADRASSLPRVQALNLALTHGRPYSLPASDREAIVSDGRTLNAQKIRALGLLSIDQHELSWSGSLTQHSTDVKLFGNGNAVVNHEPDAIFGNIRALDEKSRFTPPITEDDTVDIGFNIERNGQFVANSISRYGGLDIFSHNFVIRCHARYGRASARMKVHTIDTLNADTLPSALSVGPMLERQDFTRHAINDDKSLGSKPPFIERPMARAVAYETQDGVTHLRLYDGHPEGETCPGITPSETLRAITSETQIAWGCFLDPGKTAKICARIDGRVESFGNGHYVKWPTKPGQRYVWVPGAGRRIPSMITLQ